MHHRFDAGCNGAVVEVEVRVVQGRTAAGWLVESKREEAGARRGTVEGEILRTHHRVAEVAHAVGTERHDGRLIDLDGMRSVDACDVSTCPPY
jgi:hypothetical protein